MEVKGYKIEPGANLASADLSFGDLTGVNLENADLSNANLTSAILFRANLANANLAGADLSSANLGEAILTNADLSGANLTDAALGAMAYVENKNRVPTQIELANATLVRVNLSGANLSSANLTRAIFAQADLSSARLNRANFEGTILDLAILRAADLEGANLTGKVLKHTDFTGANLSGANLAGAELQYASFRNANLAGTNLAGAKLKQNDFSNANLEEAKLVGLTLSNTNFQAANLKGADLTKAVLSFTNFKGAQLSDTIFDQVRFISPDFTGATGVDQAFVKNAAKLVSRKSKQVLGVILAISLVALSIGAVLRSIQNNKEEQAFSDARSLAENFCNEVALLKNEQSISNLYAKFEEQLSRINDFDRFDYSRGYRPLSAASGCRDDASERFTPVTVPEKSDAELAAEGRSCSQQWRRARSETLSGSSNDVQLRATVYACDTPGDWVLGAIDNGEYSEPLLDVICKFERRAPACN